jgi:hypothetical protein
MVIGAASHHGVSPAIGWTIGGLEGPPDDVRGYFEAAYALNLRRNQIMQKALALAVEALSDAKVTPVLLKGAAALATNLYPAAGVRMLGDLDILVEEPQLKIAVQALEEAGFRASKAAPHAAGRHHHLPVQEHVALGVGVELHFRICERSLERLVDTRACLGRVVPHRVGKWDVQLLHPEDQLIHTIAHGQISDGNHRLGRPKLRQLLEVAILSRRSTDAVDWQTIEARFASTGYEDVFRETMAASFILLDEPVLRDLNPDIRATRERMMRACNRGAWQKRLRALVSLISELPDVLRSRPHRLLKSGRPSAIGAAFLRRSPRW